MKATQEQRDLIVSHFEKFERDHILDFAKEYKTQGYSLTRFIYDVYYTSGFNKILFEKYGYQDGLDDDNIGTLTKWVLKHVFGLEYQKVSA